jgi:hypothetical protein
MRNWKIMKKVGHIALGLAVMLAVFPSQAQQEHAELPAGMQRMVYEVYAGGIHAVQATLEMDMSKSGRYKLVLSAHTRGFLGKIAPWHGSFQSYGWVLGESDYRPELHRSVATWRGEPEIKEYKYTQDKKFVSLTSSENEKPAKVEEVDDELTQGTTDALTAALIVLEHVAKGEGCASSAEVFDGKRRFEMVFSSENKETLEPTKYNIFKGEAISCMVEVVPIAGEWHAKPRGWMSIQEQGRERGTMPTMWAAMLENGQPAVPVKIRVKTEYGTLFMHLAEYSSGGRTVVAEKREPGPQ